MTGLIVRIHITYIVYVYVKYGGGYPKIYVNENVLPSVLYLSEFWMIEHSLPRHIEKKKNKVKITSCKKYRV